MNEKRPEHPLETGKGKRNIHPPTDKTPRKSPERDGDLASFPRLNPNPVIEMDFSGTFLFANEAAYKILDQLGCGSDFNVFLPPDFSEILDGYNRDNIPLTYKRDIEIKDRIFESSIQMLKEQRVIRSYLKEITERKQIERELKKNSERFEILSDTASRLLASTNPQKMLNELCVRVMKFLDCQMFFHYILDASSNKIRLISYSGIPDKTAGEIETLDLNVSVCGCVAQDGQRIIAEKIAVKKDPRTDLVRSFGVQAYACHPLLSQEKVLGTLSFGTCTRDTFDPDEVSMMKTVTDLVAMAMNRIKNEEALRESEERFSVTLSSIGDAVISTDMEGKISFMNAVAESLTGWTLNEARQKPIMEIFNIINEESRAKLENPIQKVLKDGDIVTLANHTLLVKKDKTEIPIDDSGAPIKDRAGNIIGAVLIFRDISEKKQREKEIEHLASFPRLNPAPIIEIDRSGTVTYANEAAYQTLKKLKCGGGVQAFLPPDTREILANNKEAVPMREVELKGHIFEESIQLLKEKGSARFYVKDITARKLAQEALRASEAKYKLLNESILDVFAAIDHDLKFTFWNKASEIVSGISAEEAIGKTRMELFGDSEATRTAEKYQRECLKTKQPLRYENEMVLKGQKRWFDIRMFPTNEGASIISRDITDIKQAQEALRDSEKKLSDIYASMSDGLALHEIVYHPSGKAADYVIIDVNPAFEKITGIARNTAVGRKATELYSTAEAPYLGIYSRVAATGNSESFETYYEQMNKHFSIGVFSPQKGKFATVFQDISERKKAEIALRESEDRFKTIAETVPVLVCITRTKDSIVLFTNELNNKTFGLRGEDIIGTKGPDYYCDPADRVKMIDLFKKQGFVNNYRLKVKKNDGTPFWIMTSVRSITYNGYPALIGASIDVTEYKKLEEELQESEERFRNMFERHGAAMLLIDPESGAIIAANEASIKFYGYSREKLLTMRIEEINQLPPEEVKKEYRMALEEKRNYFVFPHLLADGKIRWVEVYSTPFEIKGKAVLFSVIHDITERKKAEEAQRESERRLDAVFNGVAETIMLMDTGGVILAANETAAQRWGMAARDLIGRNGFALTPPDTQKIRAEQIRKMVETARPIQFQDSRDGRVFDLTFYPVSNTAGKITEFVVFNRDITELKEAEEALRENEQRLKFHFENSPLAVVEWDADFFVTQWSIEAERIFGWKKSETIGKRIDTLNLIYTDDIPIVDKTMERLTSGKENVVVSSNRNVTKAGNVIECTWYNSVLLDPKGKMTSVMSLVEDITDRKKKESELNKLNRTLHALSRSGESMVRAKDETVYMNEVCRIVVEDCGYPMVWIGFALNDQEKSIIPVSYSGFDQGYLDTLKLTWADTERGQGPTGTAIRTGKIASCKNMMTDPKFLPWREEAVKRGYSSSIVFPLMFEEKAFAAITLYSKDPNPFSQDEITLLSRLADNLAYGIMAIRSRVTHEIMEKSLADSQAELNAMIENVPLVILLIDSEKRVRKMNSAAVQFTSGQSIDMVDRRKGNVLHCANCAKNSQSCGLSDDCNSCGLHQIITDTFKSGSGYKNREVRFTQDIDGTRKNLVFHVSTALVHTSHETLTLVCFDDVTEQKETEYQIMAFHNKMKSDLIFAGSLQQSIEPPEVIEEKGYSIYSKNIHCEEMAGDYLDIIRLEHYVYIISADVSGHGLISSFFIFIMKAIIKTVLIKPMPPDQLLSIIGKEMKKYLIEDYFLTINIIEVNLAENLLSYSTAGHPPFFIYNEDEIKILKDSSTFISNLIPSHMAGHAIALSPHDKILVFTDGIYEIVSEKNKILGMSFIEDFIKDNRTTPPGLIINKLIKNLKKAGKKETFDDDISVCVFGINSGKKSGAGGR